VFRARGDQGRAVCPSPATLNITAPSSRHGGGLSTMDAHGEPPLDEAICLPDSVEKQQHADSGSPVAFSLKSRRILEACHESNLDALVELATAEGGLVNDEIRKTACKTRASPYHPLIPRGHPLDCCCGSATPAPVGKHRDATRTTMHEIVR
jgi:hypothetical protein